MWAWLSAFRQVTVILKFAVAEAEKRAEAERFRACAIASKLRSARLIAGWHLDFRRCDLGHGRCLGREGGLDQRGGMGEERVVGPVEERVVGTVGIEPLEAISQLDVVVASELMRTELVRAKLIEDVITHARR